MSPRRIAGTPRRLREKSTPSTAKRGARDGRQHPQRVGEWLSVPSRKKEDVPHIVQKTEDVTPGHHVGWKMSATRCDEVQCRAALLQPEFSQNSHQLAWCQHERLRTCLLKDALWRIERRYEHNILPSTRQIVEKPS